MVTRFTELNSTRDHPPQESDDDLASTKDKKNSPDFAAAAPLGNSLRPSSPLDCLLISATKNNLLSSRSPPSGAERPQRTSKYDSSLGSPLSATTVTVEGGLRRAIIKIKRRSRPLCTSRGPSKKKEVLFQEATFPKGPGQFLPCRFIAPKCKH